MHGYKELAVIESNPCRHICTPVTFSLYDLQHQTIKRRQLDDF